MEFNEIKKASLKFETILVAFINDYLEKFPTYDIIRERYENGEVLCIDYRTLEISVRNESELEEDPWERNHWRRHKYFHTYDFLFATKDDFFNPEKRAPNRQDTDGMALDAVYTYVHHNKIEDFWSLPSFLLPTPEEIAEEQERERKYREEQERKRIEKERIRAEHAYNPQAEPILLIIPDVHGRTFWKKSVESYPNLPVVFLGDYVDPYCNSIEHINPAEALDNLHDIMQYKQIHGNKVTMLLGNHDLHYFYDDMDCSRKDEEHAVEILQVFKNNIEDFQIATSINVGDKSFLFSHAGIVPGWLDLRLPDINKEDAEQICFLLNTRLQTDESFIRTLIADASYHRWGPSKFGSPVWADILEHEENEPYTTKKKDYPFALSDNIFQIFGHTQQEEDPVYRPHFCCLDCRRPFLLTADGKIMEAE